MADPILNDTDTGNADLAYAERIQRARVRHNFECYAECLSNLTWHFRDQGMTARAAAALAHDVLDLNAERWASVRREMRRGEARAAARDVAAFKRRAAAVTRQFTAAVQ